jgi:hypothetical protein
VEEELAAICGWQTTSPVPADLVSDSEAFTMIHDAKLVVIVVEICGVSAPGILFAVGLIVFDAEAVGPGAPWFPVLLCIPCSPCKPRAPCGPYRPRSALRAPVEIFASVTAWPRIRLVPTLTRR